MRVLLTLLLAGTTGTAPVQATPLPWQPCGEHGAECATLQVPMDWSRPDRGRITLALSRLKAADPTRRVGVLFFNPGGPGGPARPMLRDYATTAFPAALRERFDIVGVDPRGVGESTPAITCEEPTRGPDQFPGTREGYQRLADYNRRVGEGCARATGPLIDHVDTPSAARDFDAVRKALGERRVSWLGLSYGTLLATTYARMYPERVRAAVLDGPLDHTVGSRRMALDEARETEEAFTRFADWCRTDTTCAMHGKDVGTAYRELLARARRHPVPAQGHPAGVTAPQIGHNAYNMLSFPATGWAQLARGIRDATATPPNAAEFATEVSSDAAYRTIACHDFPSDVRGHRDLASRQREIRKAAPTTGGYVEGWDIQAGCLGWPIRPANPWGPTPVRGAPSVLIVGSTTDPATPEVWGRGLARQIKGSKLLIWKGVGHTAYFNDSPTRSREVAHLVNAR
ncbi:alpha/beta hydrolase [Actinomadura kijaniata]|uniref:Pimeloyl-ACP methyl ester carboxylesterase n=1 Tax=Actinomadura namibiensis TaxID=182080 RepID=A0A7W3LJE5_ACTNM|nr:alpha/beta fold hydrolase [Actinomadura namibiensis]MBA8949127.1 pimeloyl-ACP methyl ester carboxylesterase [Actinomadura namibiensis]